MTTEGWGIYTLPIEQVTADVVAAFLEEQRTARMMTESLTCELKAKRSGTNVARAVAALANSLGGVVIVGVDEDEPDLSEAPGLPQGSLEGLAQHLREVLSPRLEPEFAPVRIPGKDTMIVVIRVEPDTSKWPVVCGGSVVVRGPGVSAPATHEQILDIVRRRGTGSSLTTPTYPVRSTHAPAMHDPADSRGDFLIRLATAVYARDRVLPITFGRDMRERLESAFVESPFTRAFGPWRPRGSMVQREPLRLSTEEYASTFFSARLERSNSSASSGLGPTVDRLRVRVQSSGNQLSVYVEAEGRRPVEPADGGTAGRAGRTARLGREEMLLILLLGLQSLSTSLVPAIVDLVGGSPLAVDEIAAWVEDPSGNRLSDVLDLDHTHRIASGSVSQWQPDFAHVKDLDDAVEVLRAPLERLYVDLGIDDEVSQSGHDLTRAVGDLRRLLEP